MNYFKIFEIKEEIDIDLDLLEEKYHAFQRSFHPDKAGTGQIEKSIAFNEGFEVLSNEFLRLAHLLKINNIDVGNDSKAPKVAMEVLQEVMQIQESSLDADENEKDELKKNLSLKIKESISKTKDFLVKKEFGDAAQSLMKAKYLKKALKDLKRV